MERETKVINQPRKAIVATKTYLKCMCVAEQNYKDCTSYEPVYYVVNKASSKRHKPCRFVSGNHCMYFEMKS